MTYIDIDGIVEHNQKLQRVRKIKKTKLFTNNLSSRIFKFFIAFLFLGFSSFIFSQIFNQLSDFRSDIVAASSNVNNPKIAEKVNFRALADIEPAAGGDIDDLLDWESSSKTEAAPPVASNKKSVTRASTQATPNTKVNPVENIQKQTVVENNPKGATINQMISPDEIKTLKESISNLSKKIDGYSRKSDDHNDRINAFNNNINNLNKRISDIESQITSLNSKISNLEEVAKKVVESKIKAQDSNSIVSAAISNKSSVSASNNIWVLRSARQGVAWVSYKGRDNLTSISVGEELEGLGKVLEIGKNSSGKWFVKCEKGNINQ